MSLTGLEFVREPFLANDILVGELSRGGFIWTGPQTLSHKFDLINNGGHASFGPTGIPTLAAGQTYRFIYHPSFEENDLIEFRLAADGTPFTQLV